MTLCNTCGKEISEGKVLCDSCKQAPNLDETKKETLDNEPTVIFLENQENHTVTTESSTESARLRKRGWWCILVPLVVFGIFLIGPMAFSSFWQPSRILLGILLLCWVVFWLTSIIYGIRLVVKYAPSTDKELRGLGGWLILPMIGMVLSFLLNALGAVESVGLISEEGGKLLSTDYLNIILFFEILTSVVALVCLILFFSKKRVFPRAYIGFLFLIFSVITVQLVMINNLSPDEYDATELNKASSQATKELGRSVFQLIIWSAYMHKSVRVRNTFVR